MSPGEASVESAAAAQAYPLGRSLPAEVQVGGKAAWNRYQQFPVFSLPWLLGRTRVFALAIFCFALLSFLGLAVGFGDVRAGVIAGIYGFVGFLGMATCGPALASVVRHRRWPESRERSAVVIAWLLGVVLSYFIDSWASGHITRVSEAVIADAGAAASAGLAAGVHGAAAAHSGLQQYALLAVNLLVLVAIYGVLGGGLALRAYFSERRRWEAHRHAQQLLSLRAGKQAADLRLGVLQAQVEPHFLFNTLASVRALVRRDPERAERTLDALVDHLRDTIPRLREGQSPMQSTLGQQLDICASYLEVMRLRTGDRLSWSIDATPALRALPYPPLLLITLVENAVKHGIEPRPGPGRITLRALRRDDLLEVSVTDDGLGLRPGAGGGMGLANVRAQLDALFGARAALRLQGREGEGTVAVLATPLESLP